MGCATSSEEAESSCENSSSNRKNRRRSSAKTAQKRGSLDGGSAKATKTKGSKRSNSLRRFSASGASSSSKGSKATVAINPLSRPPPAAVMERRRNASLSTSSSSTNSSSGGGPRTVKVTSSTHGKARRGVGPTSSLARAVLSAQLNSPGTSQSTSLMSPHHHNQRGSPSYSVSSHSNSNSSSLVRDADGLSRSQNHMDGDSYTLPSILSFNQDGSSGGGGGGISTFASQEKVAGAAIGDDTFTFLHDDSENSNDNSKKSDGSRVNFEAGVDVANLSCYSETLSHSGTLGDESRRSSDDPLHSSTTHEGTASTTSCKSRRFADKFKSVLSATEFHAPKILRPSSIECSVNSNLWSLENTGEDGSTSDEDEEEDDYQSALNE